MVPLLEALGHDPLNIVAKVPVFFQRGRQSRPGRKPEADFVVYAEKPFSRATSLIVVESKHPTEPLDGAKEQGESYAHNLRAPVLLLTNGQQLEVWQLQPTTESTRVLACCVDDLPQHRGVIEGILSVEALRDHCKRLAHKRFDLLARDLSAYEQAAHERARPSPTNAVPRRLRERDTQHERNSRELLNLPSRGAVITAASGFGKTQLARSLVYESIERRWEGSTEVLPIDVFLPDLAQSGQRLEAFLAERVAAQKPGFSVARLKDIARDTGLLLIADGFERIEALKRPWVEGQLRTLLIDQPHTRIFVMSRAQAAPTELNLPTLELQGFSPDELRNLAELHSAVDPDVRVAFSGAPDYVYRLGEIPLLADQVMKHYASNRSYPSNLSALFEGWLARIFAASGTINRALDRQLLERIAVETVARPLDVARACELFANRADSESTLQRLAEHDAITVRGTTIELQHEALADHLRAVHFWNMTPSPDRSRLEALAFDPSSLFAFLLVSAAPTADARSAAWEAIAQKDMRLAIRSLRFSGFDNPFIGEINEADGLRLARDLQSTIETLITSHLEPVSGPLREGIAGQPVEKLGVVANVGKDDIAYFFFDATDADEAAVLVGADEWERAPRMYYHALHRMGFGPEAGRVLAVNCAKQAIEELIEHRSLLGGRVWTEERAFGRLRHLVRRYRVSLDPTEFDQALKHVEPLAGQWVGGSRFTRGQSFAIDELLADLRWLREQGIKRLGQWWEDLDQLNLRELDHQQRFAGTLDAYYRRRQLAYNEVVERSLPAIRPYLRTHRLMPLRMEIVAEFHTRRGYEDITLNRLRWPVRSYDDAGADVTFTDASPNHYGKEFIQRYIKRTDQLLAKFGRAFPDRAVQWGGGGVPDLKGRNTTFGKLPDESAVVAGAMAWLQEDLKDLFSEVPNGRWQIGQDSGPGD